MTLPALPSYARALVNGSSMSTVADVPKPMVERVEMDRGPAQQRLVNARILRNMTVQLLFESNADVNNFDNWYVNTIGVIGWFTMTNPRTGAQITARFPSGVLGDVVPVTSSYTMSYIQTTIEYYA